MEVEQFMPKESTRRPGKSRNDRFFSVRKAEPRKPISGYTSPMMRLQGPLGECKQTVRVIMHFGVVHASGQHPGKEREIPFRAISIA